MHNTLHNRLTTINPASHTEFKEIWHKLQVLPLARMAYWGVVVGFKNLDRLETYSILASSRICNQWNIKMDGGGDQMDAPEDLLGKELNGDRFNLETLKVLYPLPRQGGARAGTPQRGARAGTPQRGRLNAPRRTRPQSDSQGDQPASQPGAERSPSPAPGRRGETPPPLQRTPPRTRDVTPPRDGREVRAVGDPPAEAAGAAGRRALTTLAEFVNQPRSQNLYKNNMILTLSKFLIAVSMANLCVYTYILNMDLFKICCLDAPFRARTLFYTNIRSN